MGTTSSISSAAVWLFPLIAAAAMFLIALPLLLIGLRGRRAGDHPHCRRCGFDLFGAPPGSTQCPECGAATDAPRATVVGVRRRRRGPLVAGLALLLLAAGLGVPAAWRTAETIEWIHFYPTTWLAGRLDDPAGPDRLAAYQELARRTADGSLVGTARSDVADKLLVVHADPTKPWDAASDALLAALAQSGGLTATQLERYCDQSVQTTVRVRPRVRRDARTSLEMGLRFNRMALPFNGRYATTGVTIDGKTIADDGPASNGEPDPNTRINNGGSTYHTSIDTARPPWPDVPLGKHAVEFHMTFDLQLYGPGGGGPAGPRIQFAKKASTPTELFAAGSTVDDFKAAEPDRAAMEAALPEVEIVIDGDTLVVRPRLATPPLAVAADVLLRPAGAAASAAWAKAGPVRAESGSADTWYAIVHRLDKTPPAAAYDVRLVPSQAAADPWLSPPPAIWGDELLRRNVPATVSTPAPEFVLDESLRAAVEKAVTIEPPTLSADGRTVGLTVGVDVSRLPASLNHAVRARVAGVPLREDPYPTVRLPVPTGGPPPGASRHGFGLSFQLPEGTAPPAAIDVILFPRPDRGDRKAADSKPWGHEISFKNHPLNPAN